MDDSIDLDGVLDDHADWLRGADTGQRADLRDATLRHADLRDADLRDADLWGADLRDAVLRGAVLRGATLRDAVLRGADLEGATLPAYERLPDDGSFTAYKGCNGHVVKLHVPADAARVSAITSPKCRVEYAEVAEVLDADGEPCEATEATGWYDDSFVYAESETVEPDGWDDDTRVACTHGIHVYPTLREAVEAAR